MSDEPKKGGKRAAVDWAVIEKDYRLGQLTVREIARRHDIAPSSITRRAEKDGWTRDLTDEIRAKTRAALLRNTPNATPERNTPSREDVAVAVMTNVELVREHRTDIKINRAAATKLLQDLHDAIDNRAEIEEAIEEDTEAPEGVEETKTAESIRLKKRARMLAAVALPSHADVANKLAATLKTLIPLERQAFNLQDGAGDDEKTPGAPTQVELGADSLAKLARLLD